MKIVAGNVAVIEGDEAHAKWIEEWGSIHHDPFMRDAVCRHIKPGDVVIQGGANIGTLTRAMIDAGAKVVAFEPNFKAMECLKHNCPDIYAAIPCALSHATEVLYLNRDDKNAGASFVSASTTEWKEPVVATHIDAWNLDPSLCLLDCEGYEVKALRGARQTIARCRPVIICEVNRGALARAGSSDAELLGLIEEMGYSIRILQPDCKIGDLQYDVEAIPK